MAKDRPFVVMKRDVAESEPFGRICVEFPTLPLGKLR